MSVDDTNLDTNQIANTNQDYIINKNAKSAFVINFAPITINKRCELSYRKIFIPDMKKRDLLLRSMTRTGPNGLVSLSVNTELNLVPDVYSEFTIQF